MKTNSPTKPNLHLQKALASRSAAAKKCNVIYTALEVSNLPLTHPIRAAYTRNGDRGVVAYLANQPQA